MILGLLFAFNLLLQLGDIITTNKVLNKGGVEANPVIKWLMDKVGTRWFLIKYGVTAVLLAALVYLESVIGLVCTALIYIAVVGWNLYQLKKV